MSDIVIAVTEPEYSKGRDVFAEAAARVVPSPAREADLAAAVSACGARHVIVGVERYGSALYAALPRGSVVARFGVGHDGIDKRKATAAGLLCTNTPGVLADSVAELAMLLVMAAARRFDLLAPAVRAGEWAMPPASEVGGKRLAVIGCGTIGRAVARIAAHGFRMSVAGFNRTVQPGSLRDGGFEFVTSDFAEAVSGADFVSLHIAAVPETRLYLDAARIALLPAKAWLINTARGSVVDEAALYNALAGHRLAGAALDVFETEPYAPADPARDLRALPNVIFTPHVGSNTREANRRMAARALRNIELAESGDFTSMDLLNPDVIAALK